MASRPTAFTAVPAPGQARTLAPVRVLEHPGMVALAIVSLGTIARLIAGAMTGLSVDESYEVAVSRSLSLSYFDHPPLSFWIPALVAKLAHSEAGLLLRLPFIALFAGTSWLMYRLTTRLFGSLAGLCALLLLTVSPVFTFTTGGWVLPDGPLMFSMLAAAVCLERVLVGAAVTAGRGEAAEAKGATGPDAAAAWRWWLGAGVFTGLALLSKYHGIFVLAGALVFVATRRQARQWLERPQPYAAALVALVLASPVLIWNGAHGWVSFRFQGGRGAPSGGIHWLDLLRSLGGQAAYLLPWIWVPAAWLLVRALLSGPRDARRWFLACLAAGPIVFFTLPALGGRPGLPHWEAPGWLFTFPLLGALAANALERGRRGAWVWLAGSVAGYAVIWLLGVSQMATGWAAGVAPQLLRRGDPSWEVVDWADLAPALAARGLPTRNGFVAATRWMDTGKVAYALGPAVPVTCLCQHPHHFHFSVPQQEFLGRDAVLVLPPGSSANAAKYAAQFRSLEPLGSVTVHRRGRPEFVLPLYLGHTFQSPVPEDLPR